LMFVTLFLGILLTLFIIEERNPDIWTRKQTKPDNDKKKT